MSTIKAKQFHLIEDMDIAALVFAAVERTEAFAARVTGTLRTWVRRSDERRQLAHMNEHMLNDIGLSRFELDHEVAKYFWQK